MSAPPGQAHPVPAPKRWKLWILIEELARCGVRVEFVKGPRGDSPEDQLLVQFQGIFAEYEKG
jgi:hypothetical protein